MEDTPLLSGEGCVVKQNNLRFRLGVKALNHHHQDHDGGGDDDDDLNIHVHNDDDDDDAGRLGASYLDRYICKLNNDLMLTAVFVVAFDVKAGNIIEWQKPTDLNLIGVEFKALVSGSHHTTSDFVYFRHGNMYGLSCFEHKFLDGENVERGSRMKSVAVLSNNYNNLATHFKFLQQQVSLLLENPGHYDDLEKFWEVKRSIVLDHNHHHHLHHHHHMLTSPIKNLHPQHSMHEFLKFFGAKIFILWKLSLLGKRIIFYSPPPIGSTCFWVHCTTHMAAHNKHKLLPTYPTITPYFYINVTDIDDLILRSTYIACTTEKIFEMKTSLYDVFIDNGEFIPSSSSSSLKNVMTTNKADEEKYTDLINYKVNRAYNDEYDDDDDEAVDGDGFKGTNKDNDDDDEGDDIYLNYFNELNNTIFSTLLEASSSDDRQVTSSHMKVMNFDPSADKLFVSQLAEVYAIDVFVAVDNPCCPT